MQIYEMQEEIKFYYEMAWHEFTEHASNVEGYMNCKDQEFTHEISKQVKTLHQ
jgi:hypothetical protein